MGTSHAWQVLKNPHSDWSGAGFQLSAGIYVLFLISHSLIALVQSGDHLIGDVEGIVGVENIVTLLGKDERELLVLVVFGEEVVDTVGESLIILAYLFLVLVAQALLQLIALLGLHLQIGLDLLRLVAAELIRLDALLEVGCGLLKALLLTLEGLLDVGFLALHELHDILPVLILAHDGINFDVGNLHVGLTVGNATLRRGVLGVVLLWLIVARGHTHSEHGCNRQS